MVSDYFITDIVETIMEHMLNASRTRRQVVNQLVNMGVVEDRKMLRKKRKKEQRKRKNDDGFVVVSWWLLMVPSLLTKLATSSMCCKMRPIHYGSNTILIPLIPELLLQNVFCCCCFCFCFLFPF